MNSLLARWKRLLRRLPLIRREQAMGTEDVKVTACNEHVKGQGRITFLQM